MRRNQNGMAALVVTIILVAFLSAIGVGFAVIMNRETHKSLEAQLAQAAYDAAASGINDSINFLRDNPATQVSQCQDLLGPGKPLNAAADLSGNGNTRYTCVLINTSPTYLSYDSTAADKSQVIKVTTSPTMGKIMVSWQSSNPARRHIFVPAGQAGQLQLFDETTWNTNKYPPLMRVSIYPVPADSKDVGFAAANNRTYFLYPQQAAATDFSVSNMPYSTASGTLQPVGCGVTNNNGQFNGTADYDCNLIIKNLPSENPAGYIYYLRLTPLYQAADIKIRGNDTTDSSQPVQFVNTQAIVDVTAQSGGATKRLQASIDISGLTGGSQNITPSEDASPEYALRAANTICKRIQHTGTIDRPDFIEDEGNYNVYCGLPNLQKLKPPVVTDVSFSNVTATGVYLKGTVNPNNGHPTACSFVFDTGQKYDCLGQLLAQMPTTYSNAPYPVTVSPNDLSPNTPYTFKLCASNAAGDKCSDPLTFKTKPLPPTVTVTTSPKSIITGESSTINWNATGVVTTCTASDDWDGNRDASGGATSTGPLTSPRTYTYTLKCDGPGGQGSGSDTVTVTSPPPPSTCQEPTATNNGGPLPCTYPPGSGNCSDGIQNGNETGIDTGGRCGSGGGGGGGSLPPQNIFIQSGSPWSVTINGSGPGLQKCDYYSGSSSTIPGTVVGGFTLDDTSYSDIHSYTFTPSTSLIKCIAISGVSAWSDSPPEPPAYISINFFMTEGPYNNGASKTGNYCPDRYKGNVYHQYMVCASWVITVTQNANPVSCTVHLTRPGSSSATWSNQSAPNTNSGAILTTAGTMTTGGDGWKTGADFLSDFINKATDPKKYSAGWIKCKNPDASAVAIAIYNSPPEDVPDKGSPVFPLDPRPQYNYNYVTPYCRNYNASVLGNCEK